VVIKAADAFAFGQVDVALSRCRTLEGLTLSTPLTPSVTFSDADVHRFCYSQPAFEQVQDGVGQAERQYYYEQLADLFGMGGITADLERLTALFAKMKITYPKEYERLLALQGSAADLASVSERFMLQLGALPQEQHSDRIAKGADYYRRQLEAAASALAVLLEVEVDNKETSRQVVETGADLQERLGLKLAAFKTVEKKGFDVRSVQQAKVEFLNGKREDKPQRRGRETKKTAEGDGVQEDLVRLLRRWRFMKATEEGVPPFMVLQQKSLLAIATYMPAGYDELKQMSGVGPKTVEKYGKELLDMVADYRENSM
jgi:hypothetical protein